MPLVPVGHCDFSLCCSFTIYIWNNNICLSFFFKLELILYSPCLSIAFSVDADVLISTVNSIKWLFVSTFWVFMNLNRVCFGLNNTSSPKLMNHFCSVRIKKNQKTQRHNSGVHLNQWNQSILVFFTKRTNKTAAQLKGSKELLCLIKNYNYWTCFPKDS